MFYHISSIWMACQIFPYFQPEFAESFLSWFFLCKADFKLPISILYLLNFEVSLYVRYTKEAGFKREEILHTSINEKSSNWTCWTHSVRCWGIIPGVTTSSKQCAKKDEDTYYTQNIIWYLLYQGSRLEKKIKKKKIKSFNSQRPIKAKEKSAQENFSFFMEFCMLCRILICTWMKQLIVKHF